MDLGDGLGKDLGDGLGRLAREVGQGQLEGSGRFVVGRRDSSRAV